MAGGDHLGWFRRAALMLFGLLLATNLQNSFWLSQVIGVFGLVVFLAALGLIELSMALWYRYRRR